MRTSRKPGGRLRAGLVARGIALLALVAGCGSPRPEGFPLVLQLRGIAPASVNELVLTVRPPDADPDAPRFEALEPVALANGQVRLDDDGEGNLVMRVSRAFALANLTGGGLDARIVLYVRALSGTTLPRPPRVDAVLRLGDVEYAAGAGYLPAWPPPVDFVGSHQIVVRCARDYDWLCDPAGLEAEPTDGGLASADAGPAEPTELRLGTGGLLEVQYEGRWGPICDDGFSLREAWVACRQLGFAGAQGFSSVTVERADFVLDDVVCTGRETSLAACMHAPWNTHDCGAAEAQAVTCIAGGDGS